MATGTEIVQRAYREGNLIAAGTTLTTDQLNEGIVELNTFIDTLYGFELGEFLFDWPFPPRNDAPTNSRFPLFPRDESLSPRQWPYPPSNVRILLQTDLPTTLTLPPEPDDGARLMFANLQATEALLTINANGRLFANEKTATRLPSQLAGQRYLYRADLGSWTLIETATSDAQVPFPSVYDELLVLGVLDRLAPRFGKDMTASQEQRRRRMLMRLKSQYRQDTPAAVDQYNMFLVPRADYDRSRFYDGGELLS